MIRKKHPKVEILTVLAFALLVLFSLELGKVAMSEEYRQKAREITAYSFSPEMLRGSILDRKSRCVAYSHKAISIFVYPESVDNKIQCARDLERLGVSSFEEILYAIEGRNGFTWIKRDAPEELCSAVKREMIPGVGVYYDQIRYYGREHAFNNLIGSVDPSNKGLSGIEYTFDKFLRGEKDTTVMSLTQKGNMYIGSSALQGARFRGDDVYLSIDMDIQEIAYNSLRKAVENHSAKSGSVIVMDPRTGDVRAMATIGGKNLNMAVDWQYEPGSTFKLITAAAALSSRSTELDELVETGECRVQIGDYIIKDAEKHGPLDFRGAFVHSSNVGMVNVAKRTGKSVLYKHILLFGFGEKTEIDLPHEARGSIPSENLWVDVRLATISFGQGLSVTPLQMATAYAAVANGGFLIRPKIVDSIVSPVRGTMIKKTDTIRRVLSKDLADTLTNLLVMAVEEGTGRNARIQGVQVAGKTGTAQIASESGGYTEDAYISSFIGFFPAEDPTYVICVVIEEPKGVYYGGAVASPVFREITRYIIGTMNIIETARINL